MADTLTITYPNNSASRFEYMFGGVSYSFRVEYNNFSNELELVCDTASGAQLFRRNLIDGMDMLSGYFEGYTMIYYAAESSALTVIIKVAP